MAGYFSKLNGSVYEGAYEAASDLKNGVFVTINAAGKVAASAADTNVELRVKEKTDIAGVSALRMEVVKADSEVYMTENLFTREENLEHDDVDYTIMEGEKVRMKRLVPGDELVLSVSSTIYSAAAVNAMYNVAASGAVAAVVPKS